MALKKAIVRQTDQYNLLKKYDMPVKRQGGVIMRRLFYLLWLLLGLSFMVNAMPTAIAANQNGWISASCGICFWFPKIKPELFLEAELAFPPGFGLGVTVIGGNSYTFTVNGLYYYDPVPASNFALPLKLRLGIIRNEFGAGLSAGAKFYAYSFMDSSDEGGYVDCDAEATINWTWAGFLFSVNAFTGLELNIPSVMVDSN
jgi:hypothetical protein